MTASILLTSLVLAIGLAYFTKWQVVWVAILVSLGGLAGLFALLLALINLVLAAVKTSSRFSMQGKRLFLVAAFLLSQLVYLPVARAFRKQEVERARVFVEALIPKLEAYHQEHGTYPATIESIGAHTLPLPPLLQLQKESADNRNFYFLDGASYGFGFYLPDGFIDTYYVYCCGPSGTWTVTD